MRKAQALALVPVLAALSAISAAPAVPQVQAPVCTDPGPQTQDFAFTGEHCLGCLGADLELTVDDGTPSTGKGATLIYELSYANRGADSATGVVLTATVPANTTFDPTGSASAWQQVGTSSTYRLTIPELKPGVEGVAAFAVKVSTTVPVGTVLSFSGAIADDSLHGPDKVADDNAVADENLVTQGPTTVCGSITSDTLWKALDGPYLVTCELVIPAGVTLTLEPGTVVKFNSLLGVQVLGNLVARGTESRGILFTSNRSRLRRGDWDGIGVASGGTAVLEWATVEYGGAAAGPWDADLQVAQGGSATVSHSIVRSSDEYGVWVANGQAVVEDSLLADHDNAAVYVQTNSPANPTRVVRNTFSSNRSYPVTVEYANGTTAEIGENLSGSGGSANKYASVRVSGTLAGDAAWALNPGLTYLVGGDLTVARRGSLTLGPGLVVKLETAASDLFVEGTLVAAGSAALPVVFTSFKDDTAGGDTNGDGAASSPAPGDWGQVRFAPGSRASRLEHAVVAYGASTASAAPGQVRIDSEGVSVTDSTFRSSRQAGLHVTGAMSLIRGSRFENNLVHGLQLDLKSNRGLLLDGNTFVGNTQHAVLLGLTNARGAITLQGNAASGNQTNGVAVQGNVAGDFTVDASGQAGFALRLISDLTVDAGGTLTLSPGTVVKAGAAAVDLHVNGRLVADGTLARRIVFTSFKDDTFGGDTNGDGGASAPAAGDWGQVWLHTGSSGNVLRSCILAWGGALGQTDTVATLRTDTPQVTLEDTTVRRSRQHGIYAASTGLSLTRVTVENSSSSGLYVNALTGALDMTLDTSVFSANAQHAVFLDLQGATGRLVATGNTASGNGTNGVAVQGSFAGPFLFDWNGQSGLALRLTGDLTVRPGAALTLSPGVVVKGGAADHEVRVEGSLIARGTNARPVVFTSVKDDSFGGDTNGDGATTSPAPGDWGQVWLRAGSTGSVLEEAVLAWGGADTVAEVLGNLRVDAGGFSLVGGAVRKSKQRGLYASRSSGEVRGVTFEDNVQGGILFNDLVGNVEVILEGNHFLRNTGPAAFLDLESTSGRVTAAGNTATGNLYNAVGIQGTVGGPLILDWSGQTDLPLRLGADVTVQTGAVLTLSPGTVVKGDGAQSDLIVDGSLVARGTAAQPVTFTSIKDDTRGGDTNNDGAASAPAPGDWGQVWLRAASSANVLERCVLAYGGAIVSGTLADLRIDTPGIEATACTFERSRQSGVHLTATPPPPLFSGNRLQSNTGNGLLHAGGGVLDARNNWWGDPSGPFHPTLNPAGLGNRVSDNVLFDPWLTASPAASVAPIPLPAGQASPLFEPPAEPAVRQPPMAIPAQALALAVSPLAAAPIPAAAVTVATTAAPPRPSSFFGRITVGGSSDVPPGTRVSAWIGGIRYAETFSLLAGGDAVYRLDVPGDIDSTPAVEGGRPGQTIVFKVAGVAVPQTAVWQDGLYENLDLTAALGPDLGVTVTDGRGHAAPGDTVTYTLTVVNHGEGAATGVAVRDTLPASAVFVSASDGGATAGSVVIWPAFDLAEGASVTRTVTVRVAATMPAGLNDLVDMATVADDGTQGIDPTASNNAAQDSDVLDAAPDLAVTKTDGLSEVLPGTTLRYTLTITNHGNQGATGVRVTDTLPGHLTFFAASDSGAESGLTITWPPFDLPAGATVTREISGRVAAPLPAGLTALVNAAAVTDDGANGADPTPADNQAADSDAVIRKPDLTVPVVDAAQAHLDLESLALSGDVLLQLENAGTLEAAAPIEVTVFEDTDGDGAWTAGTDNRLGREVYGVPLAAGQRVPFAVPVSGTVAFRGNRIFAFIDSAAAVAELDETNNVGSTAADCRTLPAPGAFQPELELNWPRPGIAEPFSVDSASSPVVVNLTDDNGDGKIDGNDVPDIVFTSSNLDQYLGSYDPSVLRAIRGDTGDAVFDVPAFYDGFAFYEYALVTAAAGDIDLDGKPEIIVSNVVISPRVILLGGTPWNVISAYENDGRLKWRSPVYSTHPQGSFTNRDNPTIADIDRDGVPEVVVGAHVFNASNGSLRWKGTGGQAFQSNFNANGGASGAISIVADLDLTGNPEIVTGNTAYRSDGSIWWQVPYDDGYPAVANFDDDPFPEIVVVSHGTVRLHEHDGTLKWGPVTLPGTQPVAGGPPTVADFDGDGKPEIGVASSDFYVVLETDGTVKWQRKTQDFSSGMTGSTVFDFDGDGRFEVVYRDERFLRIYRGEDGTVLAQFPVNSSTLNEEPTVADVDRDGNAEILVTADHGSNETGIPGNAGNAGLRVFGDANDNWVGTRGIWNQHAYSVGNVNDDATIPRDPDWSWLSHNTFRAQVAPPGVAFSSPDLTASRGRVDVSDFPRSLRVTARIGNGGSTSVAPGISVAFYSGDPAAGGTLLGTAAVGRLAPGGFEDVSFTWIAPPEQPATVWIVADDQERERECDETNNVYAFAYSLADVGLILKKDDGRASVRFADETTYTLTVDNFAPQAATGVAVTDVMPPHTSFVAASAGGTEAGGIVTWPPFTLEPGARATRTLTVRVVDTVPPGVDTLTNSAAVTDDGSHGADPTPGNNSASDTDELLAFRAAAGGPYAGGEGQAIALDASGTADPESRIVRYDWDLDGDGAFDDATGVTATVTFPDQGGYAVRLKVTDAAGRFDTDTAEVAVTNRPPVVDAGNDRTVLEGDRLSLSLPFTDPGAADTHTAVIDWGDSTFDTGVVTEGVAGHVTGSHAYPDDAVADVRVCVTDDDGDTGCDTIRVTVQNQVPVVQGAGAFALEAWRPEDYVSCYDGFSDWQVAAAGGSVTQGHNSRPSLLYGNFLALGNRIEGRLRVSSGGIGASDGDAVGLAIGFKPGDTTNPAADYLLIDWRREDQAFNFGCGGRAAAKKGLALSRVAGVPADAELWAHDDRACNGTASGVRELARGKRFGSTGWTPGTEYTFALEATPDRLRLFIDGVLELDYVPGPGSTFPNGRLAFYGYSQAGVTYSGFAVQSIVGDEGRPLEARVGFTDAGVLDTHTATLNWGDGSATAPATIATIAGFRVITGTHSYPDDGSFTVRACATDDDHGTGCDDVPAKVRNLAPVVDAGEKVLAAPGQPVPVHATFTDAGIADTHTATIDWGDGTQNAGVVAESSGSGTVTGTHVYSEDRTFMLQVCVTDDDGETGCDGFQVNGVLDLGLSVASDAGTVVAPGQVVTYTITVTNNGTLPASGVTVVDTLPDLADFVSAGQGGVYDPETHTVTWPVGTLEPGQTVTLTLTVQADHVLPVGAVLDNTATISNDGSQGPNVKPGDTGDDQGGATIHTPPDLIVRSLDRSATATDPATLALSGTLGVEIANQGGLDVTAPFRVTVFADRDGDRAFTPDADPVFGAAEVTQPVATGAALTLPVIVTGEVAFLDAPLWAFVDSGAAIDEVDETNNLRNTGEGCRVAGPAGSRTYTTDADFDLGVLFNANHAAPHHDELRINRLAEPFPFIWVAASARGTVVKISTVTGAVLGEYLSAPNNRGRDPSRTTVDLNGNAWVGNRAESSGNRGSVVHIGLKEAFQCIDRNGNGVIDTSTGLGDIRPWPNTGAADDNGGVSTAADECILNYVRISGTGTRTVAVTPDNDLWVGGTGNLMHDLIDGDTGAILDTIAPPCGGYGGLVDPNGVLWSARNLMRYDPKTGELTCLPVSNSYGLGIDSQGNVWNAQWTDGTVTKMAPDGNVLDVFPTGGGSSRGVAFTPADDNAWIANSGSGTVTRLSNDGDLLATIPVGVEPTGVSVDAAGKVWVTNLGSSNVMRINPATNKVDLTVSLGSGAGPYNYSDMTGAVSVGKTAPQGRWTVNHDSGQAGTKWGRVRWSSWEPPGSSVVVRARSAASVGTLAAATFVEVEKGIEIDVPPGRYLQVEVTLFPSPAGETPIVYDVTAETRSGLPDLTASFVRTAQLANALELTVRIGNGGDAGSPAGTPVSLYRGDPAAGGTLISTFTDLFALAPGEYQDVRFVWSAPPPGAHQLYLIANDDGTAQGRGPVEECTRANNTRIEPVVPLPDLIVPSIDRSAAVTDFQALTISGTLGVALKNQGNIGVTDPFRVTVFVDVDRDGLYASGTDRVLGAADFTAGLAVGATATLPVPVSGEVGFRDDLIWVFADSAGVIPELDEDNNLDQTGTACKLALPVGQFSPAVEWQWSGSTVLAASNQVMMTPAVIDLTGDGVPEVVFTTFQGSNYNTDGHLRAVDGRTGAELFTVTDPNFDVRGAGSVAVGDIDLDGRPEILAVAEAGNRLLAFEHDGTFKWRSVAVSGSINLGGPALADLDRDGVPEIVVGSTVLNNDGTRRWVGAFGRGDNNNTWGPLSLVADLDLSGDPEVVAGNTAYRSNGTVLWRRSDLGDGFNAVGNFDADPFPEIVLVTNSRVYLLQHDGTTAWGPISLPGGGLGGAPTIADVDGDGQPEIGVAGGSRYVVFETNGTIKWQAVTQDSSSNVTGSSVFDFEGDGKAEVVYGDEKFLRIYRGTDGTVLYQLAKSSGTAYELPVIADVDADGNAEIVAVANTLAGFGPQTGIYVVGDAADSWLPTRPLWNQHTYHVTNVNDDGSIPRQEQPSWQAHNTYRLNLRTDGDPLAAPDLTASRIVPGLANPGVEVPLTARVGNGGKLFAPAGVAVAFYNGNPAAGGTLLGTVATTRRLEPGEFEDVTFVWRNPPPAPGSYTVFVVVDPGTGRGKVSECSEANNAHSHTFTVPTVVDLKLTKDDGRPSAVPGQTLTYTLTVTDVGTRAATGVTLTDTLPQHTTFVAASDGGTLTSGTVTWPPFNLASGANTTRTLTVRIDRPLPAGVTSITNQAAVTDDGTGAPDPNPANNTATDVDSLRNAPEAEDDAATTLEDTAVEIDLFANDSDADGDPLTLASFTQPAHGTVAVVTVGGVGRVIYSPVANFNGTDTFTYTVSDGTGGSDDATVTVTVTLVNDLPVAHNDLGETEHDTPLVLDLLANDSDLDGDTLSFLVPPHPFGGTLTLNTDGTQTYTPAPGFVGVDVFVYTITDGNNGTDSATVTVYVKLTDDLPPTILIVGVTDGECRNQDAVPVITVSDEHLASQSVTLNGQPFVTGTPVTAEGSYTLLATAADSAGNTATQTVTFTIDKTAPAIAVTGVPAGQCVNLPVTPAVQVTDLHLGLAAVSLDGVPFESGTTVSADGDYTLAVEANDTCGNSAARTFDWIIDTAPPAIAVSGVPEGQTVNSDITPVIDVMDPHLGPVTITLDGAPWVSGTVVSSEGAHTLQIQAADTCGNSSARTLTFTIDKTPPALAITGVVDGACGNADVTPVVTASDTHFAGVEVTLDGLPFTSGTAVTAEGDHTLVAAAFDDAGNTTRQERRFTIDKTPPAITIEGALDGAFVNTAVTPAFSVTDQHLGTVTATLDDQPFTSGTTITTEDDYTLVVTATDTCGNSSAQTVRFTIDTTPPAISITGVPAGCVNADVTPVFSVTDAHLDTVAVALNGQPFTSGTVVTAEGDYTLQVQASDRAGNSPSETRTFTIDKTPPAISLGGATDGALVNTDVTPVFSATDVHLAAMTAILNGAPFTSGTAVSAEGSYVLIVTATDDCGNSSAQTVRFRIDKTPPFIAITGVPEECLNVDVTPVFSATDLHLDTVTATLDDQPFTSGTAVTAEGAHTLRIEAADQAGNSSTETRTFTIDKTAPAITITGATDGAIVNTDPTPAFTATDAHLGMIAAVTATLNGAPFTSGTTITAEGDYRLVVTATDTCGNSSSLSIRFTIDKTPQGITITGVPEICLNEDVTPVFTATDVQSLAATLNDQPFTSGTTVTAEGDYTLRVTATDAAGNTSMETRTFTIDKTAPAVTLTGATDGALVNTDVTPVFSATDVHLNAIAGVIATLNGQPFTSGTAVTAEGGSTLVVTATDDCGNSSAQTVRFTIDKTPPAIGITGVPAGCVNESVTPVFTAADLRLDSLTATLNGQPFTSGTVVTADGDYTLQVTATDTAGNTASATRTWTIDKTPPAVTVTGATDGAIVNVAVTPAFSATDQHSGTVTATLNDQSFTAGATVTAEGDYTLVVTASDTCGNSSSQTVRFTIDTTPPAITVTGVPAGCVNADVTPVFTATDAHLDTVAATLNGQPFTSGTTVTAEGDYTLHVQAGDRAGNTSAETRTFTIDKANPAITLTGATDGALVKVDVTPVFSATDAHLNAVTATLNGAPFTSGTAVTADGDYTLVVTAADNCGNSSSRTVRFTIDKTPPAVTITGVPAGCVNVNVTPVIQVTEVHPATVTITLNGSPFTSGTTLSADGAYTLQVSATDAAANTASVTRTWTLDKTSPVITVTGVTDGALVKTNVTPVFSATDAHLNAVTATLNGAPFTSGTAVTADGDYTLVVTATDTCGNSSSQTVRFTIDKTPPAITITGVPAGCVNVDVTPVIQVTEVHPATVTITLNGSPFTSGTAVTAEGSYTLQVSATDAAGNTASMTRTWTIDKTPPVITVGGVSDGEVRIGPFTPTFSATDAHLSSVTATLNGQPFTSGTTVSAAGGFTLVVTAADTCGNSSSQTVHFTIGGACELYPIALHASTVADVQPGTTLPDVFDGSQSGNFGWLTWTGANSTPSLITSLTPPGNSGTYTNPNNASDHTVSVGDQVQGRPGVANASGVRSALDTLETIDIVVPVWDTATGSGSNSLYHIVGFARIRILDYRLPSQNRITARFLGLVACSQ